jgi:hypothetical protein
MGKIEIAVDGKPIFNWEGNTAEVERILEMFPRAARNVGLSATEFAANCVMPLSKGKLLSSEPVGQEMQMMGVIWFILEQDTGNAEHPGKVGAYVSNTDFAVDFHIDGKRIECEAMATSKFDA